MYELLIVTHQNDVSKMSLMNQDIFDILTGRHIRADIEASSSLNQNSARFHVAWSLSG